MARRGGGRRGREVGELQGTRGSRAGLLELCNYTPSAPPAYWATSDPSKRVAWECGAHTMAPGESTRLAHPAAAAAAPRSPRPPPSHCPPVPHTPRGEKAARSDAPRAPRPLELSGLSSGPNARPGRGKAQAATQAGFAPLPPPHFSPSRERARAHPPPPRANFSPQRNVQPCTAAATLCPPSGEQVPLPGVRLTDEYEKCLRFGCLWRFGSSSPPPAGTLRRTTATAGQVSLRSPPPPWEVRPPKPRQAHF